MSLKVLVHMVFIAAIIISYFVFLLPDSLDNDQATVLDTHIKDEKNKMNYHFDLMKEKLSEGYSAITPPLSQLSLGTSMVNDYYCVSSILYNY